MLRIHNKVNWNIVDKIIAAKDISVADQDISTHINNLIYKIIIQQVSIKEDLRDQDFIN